MTTSGSVSATRRRLAAWGLGILLALCVSGSALAQHDAAPSAAPPPPRGDGSLTVEVRHAQDPTEAKGLAVALYALSPQGPGFASGETDADGRFTFTGISSAPEIVYLVGVRYRDVPFGERTTFSTGTDTARVEIEIAEPTDQVAGVTVEELRAQIDWMGDRILVREEVRIRNAGERVISLPEESRGRAILVRRLGPDAQDFSPGASSIGEGLDLEDGVMRFRGPLYPGEQRIEYRYTLPVEDRRVAVPIEMREQIGRVVVVAGTSGIGVEGPELVESSPVSSDSGPSLASWARSGLGADERLAVVLTLPETRRDPGLISIPRSDMWLEMDDTRLTATVDLRLQVEPGAPVAGTPEAPLFHVALPKGATLSGVDPSAEGLGLVPTEDGGFDVIGPIGPGETSLGYGYQIAYRTPQRPEGIELGLRFPLEVATLNVLIADTGIALESDRLHRRRPFRSGTRNFLHREAFNVSPDEVVGLELEPLQEAGVPRSASIALTIAAVAIGGLFLIGPLRGAPRREDEVESEAAPFRAEREAIYTAIADLDHDFETGKLEPEDYQPMREDLREQAIELLRAEREAATRVEAPASTGDSASSEQTSMPSAVSADEHAIRDLSGPPATGAFCPQCGARVQLQWRFCSHCGGELNPQQESAG